MSLDPAMLAALPVIPAEELRMLWVNDWYDGPIEAVVEYRGERCLFALVDHDVITTDQPWRWVVLRFTAAQLEEEERWHRLFVEHVGDHWDTSGEPCPPASGEHARFYDAYRERPRRNLDEHEAIGVVDAMPEPKARRV